MNSINQYEWQHIKNNNPIVKSIIENGGDITDCVIALTKHNDELINRIMELECIAPRKISVNDITYIWRCPDNMIPYR